MAGRVPNEFRNELIAAFRKRLCERLEITPFEHQAKYWAASEGLKLLEVADPSGWEIMIRAEDALPEDIITARTEINGLDVCTVKRMVVPREAGAARFLTDFGAFKVGKSFGASVFYASFAPIPDARVSLVGLEYDICAPEFDYICEFLLSERGMGLKYDSLQNRPRDGKMWLDLPNGCRYEARSWERKDSLKGKEIDCYGYCEAYQLPGVECFTSVSQNLRARRGFALFPTTPDRPWVNELHKLGHGEDAEWECTCGVKADVNPHTFDATAKERDKKLMTQEKFLIHYEGQLGDFVGHVFNYQRGQATFSGGTNPELFRAGPNHDRSTLVIPDGWEVVGGADTGTYYTALLVAFSPTGDAYVIEEFPNYRYVAGAPERDEGVSIPGWAFDVKSRCLSLGVRTAFWADKNTQFKQELRGYDISLLPASAPVETRTEITREYFEHGKIKLAPWLEILPFELENACWPEEETAAGKFARIKDRDHTLDCLEHVLARRPRGQVLLKDPASSRWIDSFVAGAKVKRQSNPHLGRY
jgi:hypothetical protein